jgi:hypothetical protein
MIPPHFIPSERTVTAMICVLVLVVILLVAALGGIP